MYQIVTFFNNQTAYRNISDNVSSLRWILENVIVNPCAWIVDLTTGEVVNVD